MLDLWESRLERQAGWKVVPTKPWVDPRICRTQGSDFLTFKQGSFPPLLYKRRGRKELPPLNILMKATAVRVIKEVD